VAQTNKSPLDVYFPSHVVMVFVLELPSPGKMLRLNVDMVPVVTVVAVPVWPAAK
jgi:hypothetical protein